MKTIAVPLIAIITVILAGLLMLSLAPVCTAGDRPMLMIGGTKQAGC